MFGDFYYITKKDGLCAVEQSGGCFFTPNKYDAEKYLKRDLLEFPKLKNKVPFNMEIMSMIEKSDVIVFSDLDNMEFTTHNGSDLETFAEIVKNYKLVEKNVEKLISNFYSKRCDSLTKLFGLTINNISLDDEYSPKNWILTFDTGLKKINSVQKIEAFTTLLNNFKKNIVKLKDKPSKWTCENNKIILHYPIKSKIINFFNSKKKYNNSYPEYKFEDYIVNISSLNTKADGSLYLTINQLCKPIVNGNVTAYKNATADVYDRFKQHIIDEYNCQLSFNDRDGDRLFFEVLD